MAAILATGAAGFIGSHVARSLESAGHEVFRSDSRIPRKREGMWKRADLTRMEDMLNVTRDVDAVVHIGGIGDTYLAARDPQLATNVNGTGTLNLLMAAERNGIKRFIYASTWEVYGPPAYQPVDERHPCFPQHPYSISKFAGDLLVQSYGRNGSLRTVCLRLGTAYGRGMRETAVIPAFLLKALRKETIQIDGSGQQFRQFTHVSDIANAFYLALQAEDPSPVYNIVSPERTTIRSLAETIADGLPVGIAYRESRAGDPPSVEVTSQLAADELGWNAQVPFGQGLREFIGEYTRTPMALEIIGGRTPTSDPDRSRRALASRSRTHKTENGSRGRSRR